MKTQMKYGISWASLQKNKLWYSLPDFKGEIMIKESLK